MISGEAAIEAPIPQVLQATRNTDFTFVTLLTLLSLLTNQSAWSLITNLTISTIQAHNSALALRTFGSLGSRKTSGALQAINSIASRIAAQSLGSWLSWSTLLAGETAISSLSLQSMATGKSIGSRTAYFSLASSNSIESWLRISNGSTLSLRSGSSGVSDGSGQAGFSVITLYATVGGHALRAWTSWESRISCLTLASGKAVSSGIAIRSIITRETFRSELAVGTTRTDVTLPSIVSNLTTLSDLANHSWKTGYARTTRQSLQTRIAEESTTARETDAALGAVLSILAQRANLSLLPLGAVRCLATIASGLTLWSGRTNQEVTALALVARQSCLSNCAIGSLLALHTLRSWASGESVLAGCADITGEALNA